MVSKRFTKLCIQVLFFFVFFIVRGNKDKASGAGSASSENTESGGNETMSRGPWEKDKMVGIVKKLEQEGKYPALDRDDTLLGKDEDKNGIRDDIDKYTDNIHTLE